MAFLRTITSTLLLAPSIYSHISAEPQNMVIAQSDNHYIHIKQVADLLADEDDVFWAVEVDQHATKTIAYNADKSQAFTITPDVLTNKELLAEFLLATDEILGFQELTDENFEHDTQASTGGTTGDWFILFFEDENCYHNVGAELGTSMVFLKQQRKENVVFGKVRKNTKNGAKDEDFGIKSLSAATLERFGITFENNCWEGVYIQKGMAYYMKYPPKSHLAESQDFMRYIDGRFLSDSRMMVSVPKPVVDTEKSHNYAMIGVGVVFVVVAVLLKQVVNKQKVN